MMQVSPGVEDQVLAALMTIARATRRHADPPLDQGQLWLLRTLHLDPGQRATELAESCGLDPSTVSRHLRQLEVDGQVRREADPVDRRAHRLFLTAAGEAVVTNAIVQRRHLLRDRFSRWQAADVEELARLLRRLADDLAGAQDQNRKQDNDHNQDRNQNRNRNPASDSGANPPSSRVRAR